MALKTLIRIIGQTSSHRRDAAIYHVDAIAQDAEARS
jgi:hypothetical protein